MAEAARAQIRLVPLMPMPSIDRCMAFGFGDAILASCLTNSEQAWLFEETRQRLHAFLNSPSSWRGIKGLRHRLSPVYRRLNPVCEYSEHRTLEELEVYQALSNLPFGSALRSLLDPVRLDELARARFNSTVRRRPTFTKSNAHGVTLRYPDQSLIPKQLQSIFSYVQSTRPLSPFGAAAIAAASFKNLHPLTDGNGRASRLLFNIVCWGSARPFLYLPLYEFKEASCGAETLALREVEMFDNWHPYQRYMGEVLRLAAKA